MSLHGIDIAARLLKRTRATVVVLIISIATTSPHGTGHSLELTAFGVLLLFNLFVVFI
jgi:hypothetical protein